MNYFFIFFFISTIFMPFFNTHADEGPQKEKEFLHLTCINDLGFGDTMMCLIASLKLYESNQLSGIKVDFGSNGVKGTYYEESKGENWWEYYFDPISIGDSSAPSIEASCLLFGIDLPRWTEFGIYRKEANALIQKYIHPNTHMQEKVNNFLKNHLKGDYLIGLHYRGTDHTSDPAMGVSRMSYETVAMHLISFLQDLESHKVQIFVATDEQAFLDYMKEKFPDQVIYYEEGLRSQNGEPIHIKCKNGYKIAEEAVPALEG